jgi:thioredoxin reductase
MTLRDLGRREIANYSSVQFRDTAVRAIRRRSDEFEILAVDDRVMHARIVLLATGRIDVLPEIAGFRDFYGHGVYHCPYCDGWEVRGHRLLAQGDCRAAVDLAFDLLTWSPHVTLCATEPTEIEPRDRENLKANGIGIAAAPITELRGTAAGQLAHAQLANGSILACDALFFISACPQKAPFAEDLGCQLDADGAVICHKHAATGVPGLYVAGNVRGGIHLAIMAAAEGAEAAVKINAELAARNLRDTNST